MEDRDHKMEEGEPDHLGDPASESIMYQPLKTNDWRSPDGNTEEYSYCYMCQFPAKDGYSEQYKALQSLLENNKTDLRRRCVWAAAHYLQYIYPYTKKTMTDVTFSNHVRFHDIKPKEVALDLIRDSRVMYDQAMREVMAHNPDTGETHIVNGDKLKNILLLQDQVKKQAEWLAKLK